MYHFWIRSSFDEITCGEETFSHSNSSQTWKQPIGRKNQWRKMLVQKNLVVCYIQAVLTDGGKHNNHNNKFQIIVGCWSIEMFKTFYLYEAISSTTLPPSGTARHSIVKPELQYPDAASQLHHVLERSTFPLSCFPRRPGVCPQLRWECFCFVKLTHTPGAPVSSSLTTAAPWLRIDGGAEPDPPSIPLLAACCIVLKGVACLL